MDFKSVEEKWQKKWESEGLFKAADLPEKDKKYYLLEMFAYPSGDIHMGHFRNYIIGDLLFRYKKMKGYDILHPFGWDAFGLPAEEAAIKRGIHPKDWTLNNIKTSRATLKKMGVSYDWDREVATCLPDYYKWTQWVFLKLFQAGLAYQDTSLVNWCGGCKTVLANEQAEEGICWRCSTPVTKKEMKQWFFKITDYANRLLYDIDELDGWPENVKAMQRNWIGESHGLEIDFNIEASNEKITVFTTRPDTLFGVTFMAIAPENPLVKMLVEGKAEECAVSDYAQKAVMKKDIERSASGEKDGVFTGRYAVNPLNGERVQLWVADYVLHSYGTGIVMGVPAHDFRDFLFAKKYNIPVKVVINPEGEALLPDKMEDAYIESGIMVNSDQFTGLPSDEGIEKISDYIESKKLGRRKVNYKLRDWLISRQRYWGAPIPVIHCPKCGVIPVPAEELPVKLPEGKIDFIPKGRSPLEDVPEFINTKCPKCKSPAKRDADTMDTFVCSSWYYIRYVDAKNPDEAFKKEYASRWLPVDMYIGGIEHACGHLLYFRFIHKVLYDAGLLPSKEPVEKLFNHGMVMDAGGQIMSKSKGNVVSPIDVMNEHGVDVARLTMFFLAPPDKEVLWNPQSIMGLKRFMNRVLNFYGEIKNSYKNVDKIDIDKLTPEGKKLYIKQNQFVKKITEDIERMSYNTGVSSLMEFLNALEEYKNKDEVCFKSAKELLKLLSVYAPHVAEELWETLGYKGGIFNSPWPVYNDKFLVHDEVLVVVQINGKVKDKIFVPSNIDEESLKKTALSSDKVKAVLNGNDPGKVIVVGRKLVNIVV
ncbi:MAG: leucine--tRNA ligase [Armatimonadota bacterium]